MIEPTVVFEVAPSRYVIERKHPDQGWALIGRKSTAGRRVWPEGEDK